MLFKKDLTLDYFNAINVSCYSSVLPLSKPFPLASHLPFMKNNFQSFPSSRHINNRLSVYLFPDFKP